jgi:hypothetical protein
LAHQSISLRASRAAFVSNVISISGAPSELGTFNYSIPLTGGCGEVNGTGTITVTSSSNTQNLQKQTLYWKIYPNPNNGQFILESQVQGHFDLMDVNGKTIQSYLLQPNSAMQIEANLPAGIYFIKEKNKGSVQQLVVY